MFKKLLFPADFSETSKKALPYIKQLKGAGTEEVIVLHVIDQADIDALGKASEGAQHLQEQTENAARIKLVAIENELKSEGFAVRTMLRVGKPFREIVNVAESERVSLIVLGSHGHSNLADLILGATSEDVIRHAKIPLLVISRETTGRD